jgi:large subunit ribosomal protein L24
MATKLKVKKGDKVVVITGRDKGKSGEILKVLREENRVIVQGVNLAQRHQKQSMSQEGGIVQKELTIHVSNVALIDPKTEKPTRVGYKMDGERKVRVARRSGEALD